MEDKKYYKCLVAVTFDGVAHLIKADNELEINFDGSYLEDNLTDMKNLPKRSGIYECIISLHWTGYDTFYEPDDGDHDLIIESYKLLDINLVD